MRRLIFIMLAILAAACVPPPPVPTRSPISPLDTEAFKTATPRPIPDGGWIVNSSFERPYHCPDNAVCIPAGWEYWRVENPPCRPGKPGCELPCPSTCRQANGVCVVDNGCYWASPEFGEATLQWNYRVHSGSSAVKIFASGRMWEAGVWKQIYHVPIGARLVFSVWAQAWQCHDYVTCRWGEVSDQPAAMNIRVGIDTLGGTDPRAPSIVWSDAGESFDAYRQFSVAAVARNQVVTVFAMGAPRWEWPRSNGNDLYLDDARLTVTPPLEPVDWLYLPLVLAQ